MQLLSRWFVKSAMICLILGVFMRVSTAFSMMNLLLPTWWTRVGPTATHLLTVGWLTQLIFGVAFWLFPKHTKENPRGNEYLGWFSFITLNLGLVLRTIGEPFFIATHSSVFGWLIAISALLQSIALIAYAIMIFPRIKAPNLRRKNKITS